jgi:sulfhydrogenase subunit alpha
MSRTIVVNHLARIEGHGGITVVLDGRRVERVEFDVFEGLRLFEALVRGRSVSEIPAIVSRVCAICSHNHAIVALLAIERALGVQVTPQTSRLRELAFHGAAIESHALHVFCLALPDLLGRASVLEVAGSDPEAVAMALRLKKLGNTIQEIVGGRAVHPVNYQIGGFGRLPSTDDLLQLRLALAGGLDDCARAMAVLGGLRIPAYADVPIRCAALEPDGDSYFFGSQIRIDDGTRIPVEEYRTLTGERAVRHSNAKHSLHGGRPYLVGALARLTLNGGRLTGLARDAWNALGPAIPCRNVVMNDVAQAIEIVFSVERAVQLVDELLAEGLADERPVAYELRPASAAAAVEAPRGILFHHYEIDGDGRIVSADVVTPTAQNLAHAEEQFTAAATAAVEEVSDDELRQRLQIIARAYDPCVSCSVHVMRVG